MLSPQLRDLGAGYPGGQLGSAKRTSASAARNLDVHVGATWPISASASTQYGSAWSAAKACGRPRVWPRCGDYPNAWAPASRVTAAEWLEFHFEPAPPTEIVRVFETSGAGAAYALAIDSGEGLELVWLAAPVDGLNRTAQLLDVRLPTPRDVHRARVYLDNSAELWLEIDTAACLSAKAPPVQTVTNTVPRESREPSTARRYTRREIEGVDSLADARGVWPTSARASSEYGSRSWSAAQIIGRPNVWPRGGDHRGAWAPGVYRSPHEWVEATFPSDTPPARAIRVFETCGAGKTVELRVGAGARMETVWRGEPEDVPSGQPRVLEVDLLTLRRIERVYCGIDNSFAVWSEIDSIAVLPAPRPDAPAPIGAAYRGAVRRTLREHLELGFDGAARGRARRFTFFELMSHDWRARWKGLWPTSARASSSHGGGWSASRATGRPGLYPISGDLPGAWAPGEADMGVDWLELTYDPAEPVRAIRIFETFGAGATFAVTIGRPNGEALVYQGAPSPREGASVLEVELPRPQRVEMVCVYVDNAVPGWPQIDTVGLVP